ncbi:hypothetical protein, partial [Yersinia aldovae]|uniref:hypothetical protein n=1 Tax=Yersinia aldovae TaxID=29483 RepID=UPI000AB24C87
SPLSGRTYQKQAITQFKLQSPKDLLWCLMAGYPAVRNKETTSAYTLHGYAHSPIIEVFKHCQQLYIMSANVSNCPFVTVAREWCDIHSEMAPEALQPDLDRRTCKYPLKTAHSLLEIFRHTDYVT